MARVALISTAPVRGFRLFHPSAVELARRGVVGNRRFFLVDGDGKRLRSSLTAWPVVVRGSYNPDEERLRVRFPDGTEVVGDAHGTGEAVRCDFNGRTVDARIVDGPWTEPLSALAGHPVRIARPPEPGMCFEAPVTLMSEASIARLEEEAGRNVDGRRFRLLFTLAGCRAHEEDSWGGRLCRIGEATVRVGGPVPRCAVTTRNPETGERDLDTLRLIKAYRGVRDGEAIDFGVYAEVVQPGRVAVGDAVEPI